MKAVAELEQMGYRFTLDGDALRYSHDGERPDPQHVRPLLECLRQNRDEAMRFLRERGSRESHNPTDLEAEAEALLTRCDQSSEWTQEWAELHDRWGTPCYGFDSWAEWAADVTGLFS